VNLPAFSPLQIALGASIAVHVGLLTARFVDPEAFNRVFQDTPLEVILVNAHTNERPQHAQALAQAALAGGGEAERGYATSPLPSALVAELGEETQDPAQRQVQNMQEQQSLLLAQVKNQLAALPPLVPMQASASPEQAEREQKRQQLIKLLAAIERRIVEENARPKKRYISPATREVVYAIYYDHLRRAIEDKGTENFPEVGGTKLYGELMMSVTVSSDGRLFETRIEQGSGNRTLDRRAEAIVRSAAPFGRFNEAMRRQADQIVVISRFKFTRAETLETRLTAD
jgi:protein TonB